eukprot:822036-Amphidinium_carterae.1
MLSNQGEPWQASLKTTKVNVKNRFVKFDPRRNPATQPSTRWKDSVTLIGIPQRSVASIQPSPHRKSLLRCVQPMGEVADHDAQVKNQNVAKVNRVATLYQSLKEWMEILKIAMRRYIV